MPATLVSARGLGKRYLIGEGIGTLSLRDRITDAVRAVRHRERRADPREFWALRDVGFELHEREVLGVIGRNGAGKSTLLKIISEITEPTEGEAHLNGRVASLLEVGVGFHPELSGRENVFLNGAILGMSRAEIRRKFDEIVAFAEVEKFIDTPVKRYSSGMYVRLAFAVAAHLEPDVLIVDEVLAVGDAAFQRKCLGKMGGMSAQGRAVLVVTHNMSIVTQLCERVLWLDRGRVAEIGPTAAVVSHYMSQGLTDLMAWHPEEKTSEVFEYHEVAIEHAGRSRSEEAFASDEPVILLFDYAVKGSITPGRLSFRVAREDGLVVLTTSNTDVVPTPNVPWPAGRHRLRCTIPPGMLAPAKYFVTISEPLELGNTLHENILSFTVSDQNSLVARDQREGVIAPLLEWREETP
jgi:lipopolysaccharide transport system ATP-binding protein